MGRYSDSDDDRKKRKKKKKKKSGSRSRSGSIESRHSTKHKHSKKSKRSNRSRSRSRKRSRSRSYSRRSRSRSHSRRSDSRSRDKYYRRSRSRSRSRRTSPSYSKRYSRSRSRDRHRKRERSRDRSRERSRSRERLRRSRSYSPLKKDIKKEKLDKKEDPCANIPGFSEMTPAEQASIRMKIALKAAAAADEKLNTDGSKGAKSFEEQYKFTQAVQDIDNTGFAAMSFKSNRGDKKDVKPVVKEEFLFGTAGEIKLDPSQRKPVLIDVNTDQLAHENFDIDPEEKLDRWIQKLTNMRKKKLEGEALL